MKITNVNYEKPYTEIKLGNEKVKVYHYLPSDDKSKMIDAIRMECFTGLLLDQPKMEALFNAFIILNYTDIEVENEFREVENLINIYDYFEAKGWMLLIVNQIPKVEYDALASYLTNTIADFNAIKCSAAGVLESLAEKLPILMEQFNKMLKEMDWESLSLVKQTLTQYNI